MKPIIPSYYPSFSCIADRCQHSCCVGWEIDIDEEAAARYRAVEGVFGDRLRTAVTETEDGCSFVLDEHERCPFLNAQGLCDLILTLGEDALCEICRVHPRFRYDYSDRTEWGLGLCCEAAAALVLTWTDKVTLNDDSLPADPEEAAMLRQRQQAIAVAQDRTQTIAAREERLLALAGLCAPSDNATLLRWFGPLERLEPAWDEALGHLTQAASAPLTVPDTVFEQWLVYTLYRQLPPSLEDGCLAERLALAVLSSRLLRALTAAHDGKQETFLELARLYSAEIEYSDENIPQLLSRLARYAAS